LRRKFTNFQRFSRKIDVDESIILSMSCHSWLSNSFIRLIDQVKVCPDMGRVECCNPDVTQVTHICVDLVRQPKGGRQPGFQPGRTCTTEFSRPTASNPESCDMRKILLITVGLVIVLDQASKHVLAGMMATRNCRIHEGLPHFCDPVPLLPFFDLVMVWNRGVSFGMFSNTAWSGPAVLGVINLVVAAGLVWWMRKADGRLLPLSLALVAGGAVGNAIDRFVWGAVADFFDVYATGRFGEWVYGLMGTAHWPAFNVADIAISVGVIGLIVDSLFGGRESTRKTS
jgi:signal peptidase II